MALEFSDTVNWEIRNVKRFCILPFCSDKQRGIRGIQPALNLRVIFNFLNIPYRNISLLQRQNALVYHAQKLAKSKAVENLLHKL